MTTIKFTPDQADSLRHIALMAWIDLDLGDPRWSEYEAIFNTILDAVPFKTATK
jgi:hypothetical protein